MPEMDLRDSHDGKSVVEAVVDFRRLQVQQSNGGVAPEPFAAGAGLRPAEGEADVREDATLRRGLAGKPWVPPRVKAG